MSVSLKNIADALGVSKATVSWILSGQGEKKGFSIATIKKVKEYAKSVNYQPNLLARSLSLGKTNTVGLIIPYIDDTFYAQMVQCVEMEISALGYSLIVCTSDGNSEKELRLVQMLCSKRVDGVIMAPTKEAEKGIKHIQDRKLPLVLIDRYFKDLETNYVVVNNREAVYDLTSTMLTKGSRKMAFLTTDAELYVMRERAEGYKDALRDAGVSVDNRLLINVDRKLYKEDVVLQLEALFKEVPDVDGFCFATHYLALEALRFFLNNGMDYHQLFVLGCLHDTTVMDVLAPEMLISRMCVQEMGRVTARILNEQMKGSDAPAEKCIIKNHLVL